MVRERIEEALHAALEAIGTSSAFSIEYPPEGTGADYATNAALAAAKALGKPPRETAQTLTERLGPVEGVEKIDVAGPGFINFVLAREAHTRAVEAARKDGWGDADIERGKRIMVEYTDPNPFKEFHIGHLMSNAIGESVARILEASGASVLRANYQGDVGPHVAKAVWAKMQEPALAWGEAYTFGSGEYEAHKEEIDAVNAKVYDRSDERINALYDAGREESLAHFEELYKTLGTKFDRYFFESETAPRGLALVRAHPEVFEESDGAVVYRGAHTRVFVTSRGLPTYEAKDLGLLALKGEAAKLDQSLTITANEQKDYFTVVLEAARRISEISGMANITTHVSHGMLRFASGKMSSRKGNVITGESFLNTLREEARGKMGSRELKDPGATADAVAVAAVKYAVLRQGSGKDIIFDPEQSLSLEGDSGPYLQYAHTRAASILRKAKEEGVSADASTPTAQAPYVEKLLIRFPDAVKRAAEEFEPHYVAQYLLELAGAFNSWYAAERVLRTPEARYKLALVEAVGNTLKRGLWLLGCKAPEEM